MRIIDKMKPKLLFIAIFGVAFSAISGVDSVTPFGGAESTYKDSYSGTELVNTIDEIDIKVPEHGWNKSGVIVKADLYYYLEGLSFYSDGGADEFFSVSDVSVIHGGVFGKERFTVKITCNRPGHGGAIEATDRQVMVGFDRVIEGISCSE